MSTEEQAPALESPGSVSINGNATNRSWQETSLTLPADGHSARAMTGLPRLTLHALVLLTALGMYLLAAARYRAGQSDWAFDLTFFHNLVANAASGAGFVQSASVHELNGLLQLSHAYLWLPALIPLYMLAPHLETLLAVQAAWLASGAYPVVRLALIGGVSVPGGLALALVYLSSFPLWRLALNDFQPLLLAIPLLLWLMVALLERRLRLTLLVTLGTCMVREEVPLLVMTTTATFWVFRRTSRSVASVAFVIAAMYFGLLVWLHPRIGYYVPFDRPGTLLELVGQGTGNGGARRGQLQHLASFAPFGFLAGLLEPWLFIGALPLIAYQLFLSTYEWWKWEGAYIHHCGPLLAFTAAAAALGWARIDGMLQRRTGFGRRLLVPLMCVAVGLQAFGSVRGVMSAMGLHEGSAEIERRNARRDAVEPLLQAIPPEGRVATDYRLIALLSGRPAIYCYQSNFTINRQTPAAGEPRLPGLDDVDWMLIDVEHQEWITVVERATAWQAVADGGGYRLFRRREGASP